MDYHDASAVPRHEGIHQFLNTLATHQFQKREVDQQIKKIAKDCLSFFQRRGATDKVIVHSVENLMKEVVDMDSLSEAQKEISGAITSLNLLHMHAATKEEQSQIYAEILTVSQYAREIDDIFLLKEAIANDPKLKPLLKNRDFIKDFGLLHMLFGRKRKMDVPLVQSFIQVWINEEARPALKDFLVVARQVRDANLQTLREGQIPFLEEGDNLKLADLHGQLNPIADSLLSPTDYQNFKLLMEDILHNRALVSNTQVHRDGLHLAFNSATEDVLAKRLRDSSLSMPEHHEKMEESQPSLQTEKLKDYVPRKIGGLPGLLNQKSVWTPVLGPQDPIQPLTRTIGFATKEGMKSETSTSLDFAKILGESRLNLTIKEREQLTQLLKACDEVIMHDKDAMQKWSATREFPQRVAKILKAFDGEEFPHLRTLEAKDKEALVTEALRFAFDVNYHLANDLLNVVY
jgi:hypothetical protein